MANTPWIWTCPLCKKTINDKHDIEEVKHYIGATYDCPECNGVVMIKEDLTCSDFGEFLVESYKSAGLNVTKEQALGSYVEC